MCNSPDCDELEPEPELEEEEGGAANVGDITLAAACMKFPLNKFRIGDEEDEPDEPDEDDPRPDDEEPLPLEELPPPPLEVSEPIAFPIPWVLANIPGLNRGFSVFVGGPNSVCIA